MAKLTINADPAPLHIDSAGALRVGATRVTLDVVLCQYYDGASPEEIAGRFSVLTPADVHAALVYYLGHRGEIDAYLDEQSRQADATLTAMGGRHQSWSEVRDRLARRRASDQLPGRPPIDYKAARRPAPAFRVPTWRETDPYGTDWRLWVACSIAVLVGILCGCPTPDPAGSLSRYFFSTFYAPIYLLLRVAAEGSVTDVIFCLFLVVVFSAIPAAAIGWVLQALVVMGVDACRKRKG